MASNIKFKRSAVQNRVPTTSQLDLGELALNTYDGKLYTEINTGSAAVVEIGSKLSSLDCVSFIFWEFTKFIHFSDVFNFHDFMIHFDHTYGCISFPHER